MLVIEPKSNFVILKMFNFIRAAMINTANLILAKSLIITDLLYSFFQYTVNKRRRSNYIDRIVVAVRIDAPTIVLASYQIEEFSNLI